MSARLNFHDPAAVEAWLSDVYDRVDDIDAVFLDMLAPPEERDFGPVFHRQMYADARGSILDNLRYAGLDVPTDEPDTEEGPVSGPAPVTRPRGELDPDEPPWDPGGPSGPTGPKGGAA